MQTKFSRQQGGETRAEIVAAIRKHQELNGYPISVRELMAVVGLRSTSVVQYQLDILESLGVIARTPGHARSVRLV